MIDEKINLLSGRRSSYLFLAGIYANELTPHDLKKMGKSGMIKVLSTWGCTHAKEFLEDPNSVAMENLACEYCRLFLGPGPHIFPCESLFWVNGKREMWGTAALEVRDFYRQYGLEIGEQISLAPDHISVEFQFMAKLIEQELFAMNRPDSEKRTHAIAPQKEFFDNHIARWVPKFCNKVIEVANEEFYQAIARFTKDFVEMEKVNLKLKALC